MFARVTKLLAAMRGKTVSSLVAMFDALKLHQFRNVAEYLKYATRKVWATWKACDIVAQVVQTTPYGVYREGSKDPVKLPPELEQLLQYPNQDETFADLVYKTVFHLKIAGSAYWFKNQQLEIGQGMIRPREIRALNPKRVRVQVNRQGELIGYLYSHNGVEIPLDREEVMYFKRPHPDNDYYGLGDYEAGEELISEFVNRQEWGKQFWKNGAAPSSLMVCEDEITDQEMFDKIKAKYHAQYGGRDNSGKVAFLTGKWRHERLGLTAQEMQDIESRKLTIEEIFQLHGVPLSVAGVREAANFATADIDNQRFLTYTVYPMVRIIQDTMNTDLIQGWGDKLRIKFDIAGLVDVGKVVRDIVPLFDRGAISLNELREKAGFPRIDDNPLFDQHFVSAGLVPLDLAGVADMGATDEEAEKVARRFVNRAHAQIEG